MATATNVMSGIVLGWLVATTIGCGGAMAVRGSRGAQESIAVVRHGDYSGEIALTGEVIASHYAAEDAMIAHCGGRARFVDATEAQRVAVADPSEPGKADDAAAALPPSVERVYYVCVTREREAHAH
jgi:hypothetical protein